MQQTDKYKLNLLETSDAFSPNPLNENAQKTEAALTAVTAHADAGDAALDARVQVLELHHFACGYYTGDAAQYGGFQTISLPFTPEAVLIDIINYNAHTSSMTTRDYPNASIKIVTGGFTVYNNHTANNYDSANTKNVKYRYLAFA